MPVLIRVDRRVAPTHLVASVAAARWLGIGDGAPVAVALGAQRVVALLRVAPAPGFGLWLSPAAAGALHLPFPGVVWMRRAPAAPDDLANPPAETPHQLELGPVVGILSVQRHGTYRLFARAARRRGVLAYVFGPRDVLWDLKVVLGRVLLGGRWVRRPLPLPHVVFDRAIGAGPPEQIEALLERLSARGCAVFNGDLADKWRMHLHLASYPELRPYLPETRRLDSWETVAEMLARWGVVFVKPAGGFMGRSVVRVAAAGPGLCRVAGPGRVRERLVPAASLAGVLAPWLGRDVWIVQQGLDLVRVAGGVCDVRVLVLKDGAGRWQTVGMTVRRALPGRVVTNLHQGGTVVPWRAFARRAARPEGAPPLRAEILRLVHQLLQAIDRLAPRAGDVGVDIGVDRGGRVWLIEVNTKPGRSGKMTHPAVYGLPMDYARFLAGFGPAPAAAGEQGQGKESTVQERIP